MLEFTPAQLAFLATVFIAVVLLVVGIALLGRRSAVAERMDTILEVPGRTVREEPEQKGNRWIESIARIAGPFAKLSIPEEGWEQSSLRRRFMHAGLRSPGVPSAYFGLKTLLAMTFPMIALFLKPVLWPEMRFDEFALILVLLAGLGLFLPNLILSRMIFLRQREIFENFPDALDLLTISVEAGLSLEAAIARVADEMKLKSTTLAEELQLVSLEWRAGAGKERALRNLALRTGVEDIDTLVAMLVQSEKFGTSIGASLRVHSDMLRTKRQQRAEERAAKIAVKLVFPLVLCIFPSILIVVAGPAIIQLAGFLRDFAN
ncbi:MAG: type II secretion system F family protein [Burkholderiales bacterium]|nr:MAG: type II secretion system F family protein [Burkholderiales bacterium]